MGLFNKLKDALFEEETVEIPVITKKEKVKEPKKEKVEEKKKVEPIKLAKEEADEHDKDEVKITKMKPTENTAVIDMPKLKTETKEEPKRSVASSLTFPVFDDEDEEVEIKEIKRQPVKNVEPPRKTASRNLLHDDFYDYSDVHNRVATFKNKASTRRPTESTHFTPSPIISPVYGILNEDYRKEDIVTRGEKKKSSYEKLDLDEVRKKAYGTLEDEIEETLTKIDTEEIVKKEEKDVGASKLSDDGISIDDLLTDKNDMTIGEAFEAEKEIDLDDEIRDIDEEPEVEEPKKETHEEVEEVKEDIKEDADGEDDLFDLIDSLYAGKGE